MKTLIDFSEIPPAKAPSGDTEAFEKFAKQFFEELFNGKIEKTVGRGADGGVDIIVVVEDEKWLVSCKHYLSRSVASSDELDPHGRTKKHGCERFVGFYSGSANNGLINTLRGLEENQTPFKSTIWNNRDIEQKLFSMQNANSWILAARWFPKSYSKIFSQLVHPISHYTGKDVHIDSEGGKLWAGNIPLVIHFDRENIVSQKQAEVDALAFANENASSRAFDKIFLNRISNVASYFPGTFKKRKFVSDADLDCDSIFPSWSFEILCDLLLSARCRPKGIYTICRIWSFWSPELAIEHMRTIKMFNDLWKIDKSLKPMKLEEVQRTFQKMESLSNDDLLTFNVDFCKKYLAISEIASDSGTSARGFLAGLLCFYPHQLSSEPNRDTSAIYLARKYAEEEELRLKLLSVVSAFEKNDRDYVLKHSTETNALLKSVRTVISTSREKYRSDFESNLKCFSENPLEDWKPNVEVPNDFEFIFA